MSVRIIYKTIWDNPGNRGQRLRRSLAAFIWQLQKHTVHRNRKIRLVNGLWFNAYSDCVVSSALIYTDWPEYRELMFIRSHLKPTDILIDVGAYVGHFSLLLGDILKPGNIYTFEPLSVNSDRLLENWKLNEWSTSNHSQVAVGRGEGTVYVDRPAGPSTTNRVTDTGNSNDVAVPVVSLDDRMPLWENRSIGLIKIDVEGYEDEVFAGCQRLLKEKRPRLIMFESLDGSLSPVVASILSESKYKVFQLDALGCMDFSKNTDQNLFAVPEESISSMTSASL